MILSEAIEAIRNSIGYRPTEVTLDTRIGLKIQEAQRGLELGKSLPWFLLEEDKSLSLLVGTNSVVIPSGFIREEESEPLRYTPAGAAVASKIVRRTVWDALAAYSSDAPSGPKVYSVRSGTIRFEPRADITYSLTWSYYKNAPILGGAVTQNTWLIYAPDLIVGEAGWRFAMDLRDGDAMKLFDEKRKTAFASLFAEQVAREESGGPIHLGSAL